MTEADVLIASRRRCAICFGLDGDLAEKDGQLAHIDQNPANSKGTNLLFLCLPHHNKYDSTTKQSKSYTAREVRHYRAKLYELVEMTPPENWPSVTNSKPSTKRGGRQSKSPEQYEKRMHLYRTSKNFIAQIVREANPQFNELITFIQGVDEATFLFDESIDEYFNKLYQKAVRLRYVQSEMQRRKPNTPVAAFAHEESEILIWFTEQFSELKKKMSPFLRWE